MATRTLILASNSATCAELVCGDGSFPWLALAASTAFKASSLSAVKAVFCLVNVLTLFMNSVHICCTSCKLLSAMEAGMATCPSHRRPLKQRCPFA